MTVLALASVALIGACGDGGGEPTAPEPAPNRAPVASGTIPPLTVTVGEPVSANVATAFSDPDGDQLSFTAASSAAGVAGVAVAGSTVTVTGVAAGTATITVTATDPGGLSASLSVDVTVEQGNQAPVTTVGAIPPQSGTVGDILPVDVALFFADPDGDLLTFTAETSDAAVVTVSVEGSVVSAALMGAGMATVTVTATDPGGLSASLSVGVTVEQGNQAPVTTVGAIPPQSGTVGDMLPVDVALFFADPDGDLLTFTAETSDAAVVTVSVEGSVVSAALMGAGMATVTVTATDPGGLSASLSVDVTVEQGNQAPVAEADLPAIPPLPVGFSLPTIDVSEHFSDPDGDELTYAVESSNPSVVGVSLEGSTLTVSLLSAGTATVTVTATDPGDLSFSRSLDVTVTG